MFTATIGVPVTVATTMTVVTCASCGVPFALPDHLRASRIGDGKAFYCPNNHSNFYPGKHDTLQKERDVAVARVTVLERDAALARVKHSDMEAEVTRLRAELVRAAKRGQSQSGGGLRAKVLVALADNLAHHYTDVAKSVGASSGNASFAFSVLMRQAKVVRVKPGTYRLADPA